MSTDSDQQGESALTVIVAFGANAAVAAAKTAAAVFTGSASMLAEAAHSWADTGNQVFLLVAQRKSQRPPDAHRQLAGLQRRPHTRLPMSRSRR